MVLYTFVPKCFGLVCYEVCSIDTVMVLTVAANPHVVLEIKSKRTVDYLVVSKALKTTVYYSNKIPLSH